MRVEFSLEARIRVKEIDERYGLISESLADAEAKLELHRRISKK